MIEIKDLHKSYQTGSSSLHVLKGINFSVAEGELVAIMGSSGSGKSTLLNILGILEKFNYQLSLLHSAIQLTAPDKKLIFSKY